ncbi:response regulator receiver protein [Methylobacterium sp. 4-46]|uniref:response regulator n=1 Tax=unclassified Methylobacterium TaxID=2615210 RepID=UPI000152CF38|nr:MULTISPECIES: response regulator [Methylobacterium]ACA15993.1 response regulator receiver protein [Methylobacterium sp. 4-46]WFT81707.1 response regulator [Methylobacterium nodulans]
MNLDFGILWIEDSYSAEEEASLRRRIQDAGFIARIEVIPNGNGIEDLGRRHALFHCFDLILLDYKLRNADGDDLAPRVRQLFPSTTILFYSGNDDEDGLRSKIAAKRVEGVYCSHRQRFIERTGALIEQTARALDRLSGMRGLAMRVVAECDALMKDAVRAMSARAPMCEEKLSELDGDVIAHLGLIKERYEEASRVDLEARLDTFAVDSAKLFKHFRRLTKLAAANQAAFGLDSDQIDRLRELRRASAQFDADVLRKRNDLGHAREVEGENGWVLEGSVGIRVGDFPRIRQVFAGYIDAFREIGSLVAPRDR